MYTHMYIYIYIYTHNYIHTHSITNNVHMISQERFPPSYKKSSLRSCGATGTSCWRRSGAV